jgi:dihydrodipicolinate synthase/N-acetylneuraminate lyase
LAAAGGVDVIEVFPLEGHGMVPTRQEQEAYYRQILDEVDASIAFSLHGGAGHLPPIDMVAQLCRDHTKIVQLDVHQANSRYLLELRDAIPVKIRIGVGLSSAAALEGLAFGATIFGSSDSNVITRTARTLLDAFETSDLDAASEQMRRIARFSSAVKPWSSPTARSIKMCLKILGLPGGNGRTRPPVILPGADDHARLAAKLEELGVREWERLAA